MKFICTNSMCKEIYDEGQYDLCCGEYMAEARKCKECGEYYPKYEMLAVWPLAWVCQNCSQIDGYE